MALPTLPGDEKQDEKLNPGQQDYDRRFNDIAKAEQEGSFNNIADNYNQTADGSQEDDNINKLKERESEGDKTASGGWKNNTGTSDKSAKTPLSQRIKTIAKKRGGIVGLILGIVLGGGLLGSGFGGVSMLINLTENVTLKNDSSSSALQHRFMRVFGFNIIETDPVCANSTKSIKCKMGRISNKALTQLEKKGITPVFDNDTDTNNRKKTGYPTKNPTSYTIDLKDGSTPITVAARDLPKTLAENPKMAAKVLGRTGAFNVRINAWTGKHITEKLYKKFGLNRNGGLADGSSKRLTPVEKLAEATKKLQDKIPKADKVGSVADGVEQKVRGHLGKAGKAGAVYTAAVASCIAVKAPGYIAAGVAAVQLAQVMPVGMDLVLSPGAKAKASGVDTANSITAEDTDAIGTLLTNKTPRESDGKMTSALDSPILLAAMGVNKSKPAVSEKYTPGYSMLTNPLVIEANKADKALEPGCNVIMSPAAMYTAMTISAGVTVALSATIVGGVVKVVADFIASAAVTEIAVNVAGDAARTAIVDLAKNDAIPKASGEALGDVAGISMMSMFSAAGMARNLPVLKTSQVADFQTASLENEAFQRDMDIATMSPLDTSSKYTFLGSIVNNAQMAVLQSGKYNGSLLSSLPGLLDFSRASLSTNTNAEEFDANYCGYAADYGLVTTNPEDTPAINAAGLPCTGLTTTQMNMGTSEAIDLMIAEGWLDETKNIKDTDSIQNLVTNQVIKPETPLADYIDSCSNAETGDYIFSSAGCTVASTNGTAVADADSDLPNLKNPRSLEAMAVFLLDYQQIQMINGNDEVGQEEEAVPANSEAYVLPTDVGYKVSYGWGPRSCAGCSSYHKGLDITNFPGGTLNKPVYAVAAGQVISATKVNGVSGTCTGGGVGNNNVVQIKHANGLISSYWHMQASNITVNTGDTVTAGQQIGKIGNCGQSYGAHLHFETWIGDATDPGILGITGADAADNKRNPAKVMALFGVDIMNATYTDGR